MWEYPEAHNVVIAFGTLMAGAAAMWGAYSASKGLYVWKSQTRWQTDRELALTLLVAVRFRHEAVKHIRNPFGWSDEYEVDEPDISDQERRWKGVSKKYQDRWDKLAQTRVENYKSEIEADVLWGGKFSFLLAEIRKLENDLMFQVQEYVASHEPKHELRDFFQSKEERMENHMMVHGMGSRDTFGPKYEEAIAQLNSFLTQKLGHRK